MFPKIFIFLKHFVSEKKIFASVSLEDLNMSSSDPLITGVIYCRTSVLQCIMTVSVTETGSLLEPAFERA